MEDFTEGAPTKLLTNWIIFFQHDDRIPGKASIHGAYGHDEWLAAFLLKVVNFCRPQCVDASVWATPVFVAPGEDPWLTLGR